MTDTGRDDRFEGGWLEPPARGERMFFRGLRLTGTELTAWEALKVAHDGIASRAFVRPRDSGGRTLVELWVVELESAAAARHHLLELLRDFQSADVSQREDVGVGEVAFAHHDTAVVAARGNLVLSARNAERDVVPVLGPARELDTYLTRRPQEGSKESAALRQQVNVSGDVLDVERPSGPSWMKYISTSLTLRADEGQVHVAGDRPGDHDIVVVVTSPGADDMSVTVTVTT